jgi:predicted  nucleic acid-binding Zn-ribbon protein
LNQKSKLEKEVLSEQTKSDKIKQDLLAKNQLKSNLNGDIKIISLQITNSNKKHLDSMEKLDIIKQEYISEIKDLEQALLNRRQNLGALEDRISHIKERISFVKHLLGKLCKLKMQKTNPSVSIVEDSHTVDANDADSGGAHQYSDWNDSSANHTDEVVAGGVGSMEAWVDLLTD